MKLLTLNQRILLLPVFIILLSQLSFSQGVVRCYTDEMDLIRRQNDPALESSESFEQWIDEREAFNQSALIVGGVYQIPVVVHVIHNGEAVGAGTNISFAAIQSQIDVLNEDFRKIFGTPGHNTHPSGADTQIEFCLAQRRPDGSAFSAGEPGVNRINRTTAGFTAPPFTTNYIDATIKPWTYNGGNPTATRGWSPDKYLNIWVCNISGGILGYAQFPQSPLGGMGCGAQGVATDGVVFLYSSIGKSAVTGFPGPYNEGRTATHEIGHWLGLRHIWGDGGCNVDDFCNDTPLAGAANYGCPVGTNSCTAAPDPGPDMIQNYMDYTDDLCMNIFTNDQKMRMRIVLEASPRRALLITSDACVPPNPSDAAIVNIINPVGDNCVGSITPTVVLRNRGSNNLTSATINYSIDNGPVTTFAWTGSLTPGSSANVNLPAFTSVLGSHTFKSWNTLPNGVADPSPSLDTSSIGFVVSNGIEAPYSENFDGGVFPPDIRWVVDNPNSDCYEWVGAAATSITGVLDNVAAQMPAFGNATTGTENLITPIFLLPCNATAANIQFDVAYRRRNGTPANYERLYIEISENCGTTWNATPIYDKSGTALQVLTNTLTTYYTPVGTSDWRTETVNLMPYVAGTSKNIKFRIRAVAANGNNIYIDNFRFNATTPGEIDVTLSSVNVLDGGYANLGSTSAGTPLVATFTVTNSGTTNLTLNNPITVTGTGYTLGSTFGTTTLAAGASTTFTVNFNSAVGGSFTGNISFTNNDCDEGTFNFEMYCVATTTPPVADFSGTPTTICAGSTVTFTNLSTGATSYSWTFTGGTPSTSTATNPTVTYNTPGTYNVSLVATSAFGSDTETKANYVVVVDANGVALPISEGFTGATFVPAGWALVNNNASPTTWARSATIGVAPTANNSMFFDNFNYNDADDDQVRLPGANFTGMVSAQLQFSVAYAAYNATNVDGLEVLVSTDCGATWNSVYMKTGSTVAAGNLPTAAATTTIFTPTAGQWRTETVDLTPYVGNSKVIVAFKNLSGYGNRLFVDNINLTGVTGATPPVAGFTGAPTTICAGQSVTFTNTSTGSPTSYSWTFPGGTPGTSTLANPTVTYAAAGTYNVTLVATNAGGSDSEVLTNYITVNSAPATPGVISGTATVCSGSTGNVYSITAVPGAVSYTWTAPAGATITAGQGTTSATITMGSTSGNVTVTATNTCGTSSAATLAITVNSAPATPGVISGTATVCSGSTGNVYSITAVPGAVSYTWTAPAGATITAGQGTTSATITMGSTSGNVAVTATNTCGTSSAATLAITVNSAPATPGVISGTATVCSGSTGNVYSITAVPGAVSYTWTAPAGATITAGQGTTSATITMGSTSGNVTVTATNTCGTSSAATLAITVNSAPATPGVISGTATVCSGSADNVYSITAVPGAASYTWTAPAGATITAGQGTTSATITMGSTSGNVTVTATNTCGTSSAATLAITVNSAPATPGVISGTATVCSGSIGNVYSITAVPGAASYTWTAPAGATITAGQGTTSATITMGSTSGNVTVTATNTCGTSSAATSSISVTPTPTITLGATVNPSACGSTNGSITVNGSGTGVVTWSGASSGTSGTVSLPYTINSLGAGAYSISFNNGCASNVLNSSLSDPSAPSAPGISVVNGCGNSVITATGVGLLWSTGETTSSITVNTAGSYSVTQTVGGCTSSAASIVANPLVTPTISQGAITNPLSCGASNGSVVINGSGTGTVAWSGTSTGSVSGVTLPYTINGLAAGSYSVTFNNGCLSNTLTVNLVDPSAPSAPIVTVSNGCGSSVLSATGSNLVWSTAETTSSITVTTAGNYTVTQTVGGCTSAAASVTASPTPIPVISLGTITDPTSCGVSDGTVTINGSGSGTVNWSGSTSGTATGVTLPYTVTGLGAGNYTISFNNGCASNNLSATINGATIPPAPAVSVVDNCGYSVLTATGSNLQWSTSETTSVINVTVGGTYFVSQTVGGCTSPVATVVAAPLVRPTVTLSAFADVCINDPAFALSGGMPAGGVYSGTGVSAGNFDPLTAGYGTFLITYTFTDVNTCSSQAQQTITVGCADVASESKFVSLYPNPTNGEINISAEGYQMESILVLDASGRVVFDQVLNSENNFKLDLTNSAEGIYTVVVKTSESIITERLILVK